MKINKRILMVLLILVVLIAVVLGVDAFQRSRIEAASGDAVPAGSIPIYLDSAFQTSFVPDDLSQLEQVSFVDDEEGKTQQGWMLADVLELYLDLEPLGDETGVNVTSSSREKSVTLTLGEVKHPDNMVMFDLSGRGTLKLISMLEGFDTRDAWVQDVDRIDVNLP